MAQANDIPLGKHLFECTLGEFAQAVAFYLTQTPQKQDTKVRKGIKGIQEIFNCSEYRARQIKDSGIINDAIFGIGARSFMIDSQRALTLYKQHPIT